MFVFFNYFNKRLLIFLNFKALKPLLEIFGLESWAWDLWLGILGLGLGNLAPEAGGTGCGFRGNRSGHSGLPLH